MSNKKWTVPNSFDTRGYPMELEIGGSADFDRSDLFLAIHHSDWTVEDHSVELDDKTARELAVELFIRSGFEGRLIECLSAEVVRVLREHDEKEKEEPVATEKPETYVQAPENFTQVVALSPSISGLRTDHEGVVEGILIRTWDGKNWELLIKSEGRWGIPTPVEGVMNHG